VCCQKRNKVSQAFDKDRIWPGIEIASHRISGKNGDKRNPGRRRGHGIDRMITDINSILAVYTDAPERPVKPFRIGLMTSDVLAANNDIESFRQSASGQNRLNAIPVFCGDDPCFYTSHSQLMYDAADVRK